MLTSVTFVTLGQTPRSDLVPELSSWLPRGTTVREVGALDGFDASAVRALVPAPGRPRLVTRLADGTQGVVGKAWMHKRLEEVLGTLPEDPATVTVLLCTGDFPGLRGPGVFLHAQPLVDHGVAALCAGMRRIGVLLPLEEQVDDFHWAPGPEQEVDFAWASPYEGDDLEGAGQTLRGSDVVVLHCMGYTEEHRLRVSRAAGRPALLARRLVAAAVAQML
jgi:protein AroM